MDELLTTAKKRNRLLYWSAMANLVLFFAMLVCSFFDHRTVNGINTWIKPMKFALSFVIFLITFAVMLHYIAGERKKKFLSWGFFICMVFEMITITSQAARGVTSHYNQSTPYDILVFAVMGLFILINTLLCLYLIILFFGNTTLQDRQMLWAWRIGLILFFFGCISGGMMVSHSSHTVGAADGGPGLPFLNWSTQGGDLRAAHFFTLHALQILPLGTFALQRLRGPNWSHSVFFLVVIACCVLLHVQALEGAPLFHFR